MSTHEIANRLVELCRQNKYEEAQRELYAPDAVSTEMEGAPGPKVVNGIEAIVEKGHHFQSSIEEFHSATIEGPLVAGIYFSVSLIMDVTFKGMGRTMMEEICVYKVENGKIVSEQFFYRT